MSDTKIIKQWEIKKEKKSSEMNKLREHVHVKLASYIAAGESLVFSPKNNNHVGMVTQTWQLILCAFIEVCHTDSIENEIL